MWILFATLMGGDDSPVDEADVQAWVRAARVGNRSAARRLYASHVAHLFRAVRPLADSDAAAEDVVQDAFVDALASLHRYSPRPGTRFIGWLLTLALNRARKQRARAERQPSTAPEDMAKLRLEQTPAAATEALAVRRELLDALATLPDRDRQVVSLRYGAELSVEEVADVSRLSEANVRKICERQRKHLLERLQPSEVSP